MQFFRLFRCRIRAVHFLIALFFLASCAEMPKVEPLRNQPPRITDGYFYPSDGSEIAMREWEVKGRLKAVVIGIHGFNDYSYAFRMPAEYFTHQGIAFLSYDQRGFGENPDPGIWPGKDNLVLDLRDFVLAVSEKYPGVPLFVMGESMGGAVVVAASARGVLAKVRGIILVAPAVWGGNSMNVFYRGLLWSMMKICPTLKLTGNNLGIQASDNIEMLKELGRDKYFIKGTRVDAIDGIVKLMDEAYSHAGNLRNPALLVYGRKDQVIPAKPVRDFVKSIEGMQQVIWYEEGWHMLLRDLQREKVYNDIIKWIEQRRL